MENVNQSLDDERYLPSLVSIQFGKDKEKLIVHMHLRALEAKRFLKINICEIEYLLKSLKERAVEFEEVKILISAFRVQEKERFNCFLKSQIDVMEQEELSVIVSLKKFSKLCQLFKEKRDAKETITKIRGIQTVFKTMEATNRQKDKDGEKDTYDSEIISFVEEAVEMYQRLDEVHKHSSIQSEKEVKYEEKIDELLGKIIEKLEAMERE